MKQNKTLDKVKMCLLSVESIEVNGEIYLKRSILEQKLEQLKVEEKTSLIAIAFPEMDKCVKGLMKLSIRKKK